jgi:hypothetical protein
MKTRLRNLLIVLSAALSAIVGVTAGGLGSDLRADGVVCPNGTNWDNALHRCV